MAIISVEEKNGARTGTFDRSWHRTYSRTWIVVTDDPNHGTLSIQSAVPVHIANYYSIGGSQPEFDKGSFVNNLSVVCVSDDSKQFEVTASYEPYDPSQNPKDPTQWVPEVRWGFSQFSKLLDQDVNGKDIVNSAGVPFNPTVEASDSQPLLQITRNQMAYDQTWAESFHDTVNASPWWGYAAKTVKVMSISANRVYNTDIGYYWQVSYEFLIKKDGWQANLLDAGVLQINTGGTDLAPISKGGSNVPEPVPLDGNGKPLPMGGTPNYIAFDIYQTSDFSQFSLDAFFQQLTNYQYAPPV